MLNQLWNDEAGFILSAELVLVATLLVVGLIVGLSEVQYAVVNELGDVGEAIGSLNQSYLSTGLVSRNREGGIISISNGFSFRDFQDCCDGNQCDLDCLPPTPEGPRL